MDYNYLNYGGVRFHTYPAADERSRSVSMGKKMNKCKAPGCSKWVVRDSEVGYCLDHRAKFDPLSSLYVVKSPHEMESDTKYVEFFAYLLQNRTVEELLF